jgi:hypothetical protein
MARQLRERPRCRKVLEKMMQDKRCSLRDLAKIPRHKLSEGLRMQLSKMIQEEESENDNVHKPGRMN